jgi:hypothetical protein
MIIDTQIGGIPCRAELVCWHAARSSRSGHPDNWFDEPEEIEFRLLDRRGRPAAWLERKLDQQSTTRIERELKRAALSPQEF